MVNKFRFKGIMVNRACRFECMITLYFFGHRGSLVNLELSRALW